MDARYCSACGDVPHVHCGRCDTICRRDVNVFSVMYTCPSCGDVDVTISGCDAYERAAVDRTMRIPKRYEHEHYRVNGRGE